MTKNHTYQQNRCRVTLKSLKGLNNDHFCIVPPDFFIDDRTASCIRVFGLNSIPTNSSEKGSSIRTFIGHGGPRWIRLKYSRPGCGNLWLALGLDTRSLDPPWVWFRTLTKAIRQRHNGGHKSGSHAPKPRSWRPHADHGPQPSIIRPRVSLLLLPYLQLSLHADFVRYCSVHPSPGPSALESTNLKRNVGM